MKPWGSHQRPGRREFPRRARNRILARDRICQLSLPGCTEAATEADHIAGWLQAQELGYTKAEFDHPDNGQGVCSHCHSLKTAYQAARGRKVARKARNRQMAEKRHPGIID